MTATAHTHRILRPAPIGAILAVLLLGLAFSCSRDGKSDPRDLLRGLPRELADRLVSADDGTLSDYGRSVGWVVLTDAVKTLNRPTHDLHLKGRESDASIVTAYRKRIARVLAIEYDYRFYIDNISFMENLRPESRRALLKLEQEFYAYRAEIHRPAAEKLEKYEMFRETFERYGYVLFVALCEYELSYAWKSIGDEAKSIEHLRAARSRFTECGLLEMTCTTLCELGDYFDGIGEIDSMAFYYEKARRIAERSRLPAEAADVNSIYARYYERQGRLSLAHNLLATAMDICREYKGEYVELGHIVEAMIFEADLGCWHVVDRLLARARVLQTRHGDDLGEYRELYNLRIDLMEGRLTMARNDVDRAESFFRKAEREIEDLHMPYTREPEIARLYVHWSEGLLENNRPKAALEIARRGHRVSREARLADYSARFSLLMAKAAFHGDDPELCRWALGEFDSFAAPEEMALERERVEKFALLGRLELDRGERQAAERALEAGVNRLRRFASTTDASVQSYLWINQCEELRRLMLDLTSHDPALGYGAELLWQDFYRVLGGNRGRERAAADGRHSAESAGSLTGAEEKWTLDDLAQRAAALRARIAELGATHCVYSTRGGRIWRWTASSDGIQRDVLDTSPELLRKRIDEVWEAVALARPQTGPPAGLSENLRALGRSLLPLRVFGGTPSPGNGPLLITADGFLGRVPFEAFDVGGEGEYVPLLTRCDVAYLRYLHDGNRAPSNQPGVILVNASPPGTAREHHLGQQELKQALKEGQTVAAVEPSGILLSGEDATKANLEAVWQTAPFIYFAAHMLRDPQVPYLMLIPLAEPEGLATPGEAYLAFEDIRAADFGRCDIVVLSGCSSGAPYVDIRNAAPSLGHAFLDAGARSVVQTFWDVSDEDAGGLMSRFIPMWRDPAMDDVHALGEVRRIVFRGSRGIEDLSAWASFYIETREP